MTRKRSTSAQGRLFGSCARRLRQIAKEKLVWHRRVWRHLSHVTALRLVIWPYFLCCCDCPNYNFFQSDRKYAFPMLRSNIVSSWRENCFVGRKHGLKSIFLSWPPWIYYSECKANFILRTWSARVIWSSASSWKILLLSDTKRRKTTKMFMRRAAQK